MFSIIITQKPEKQIEKFKKQFLKDLGRSNYVGEIKATSVSHSGEKPTVKDNLKDLFSRKMVATHTLVFTLPTLWGEWICEIPVKYNRVICLIYKIPLKSKSDAKLSLAVQKAFISSYIFGSNDPALADKLNNDSKVKKALNKAIAQSYAIGRTIIRITPFLSMAKDVQGRNILSFSTMPKNTFLGTFMNSRIDRVRTFIDCLNEKLA